MVRALGLRFGVAVNRSDVGDGSVMDYCQSEGIEVMLEVPNDRRVAEKYSDGVMMVEAFDEYRERFRGLYDRIVKAVEK
jgi:MinD superfamily P-loop ATPase